MTGICFYWYKKVKLVDGIPVALGISHIRQLPSGNLT